MYFKLFKPQDWRKRSAEARRRNCAVLPILSSSIQPSLTLSALAGGITLKLSVGLHAEAIGPRGENDDVSHRVCLSGFESCENFARRALEQLDLNAGLFCERGSQLVGKTGRTRHIDGDLTGKRRRFFGCGRFFGSRGFFCRSCYGPGGLRLSRRFQPRNHPQQRRLTAAGRLFAV